MRDPSLSPFLEQPSKLDLTATSSREKIARMEYELSALKTEKKLVEQGRDSTLAKYERLLSSKNEELAQLQSNFDFVYGSRKELESTLSSAKTPASTTMESLAREVTSISAENKKYKSKLLQLEKLYLSVKDKCEHLRADLNCELTTSDHYRERIAALQHENDVQVSMNKDLLEQLKLALSINNGSERELESLKLRLLTVQKTNSDLQCRLDKFLQHKTGNELLKHRNASLVSQIQSLEGYKEKSDRLEQAIAALQVKFHEYFATISESIEIPQGSDEASSVKDFIQSFKTLQNKHLVTYDKLNAAQTRIVELEELLLSSKNKVDQLLIPQIKELRAKCAQKDDRIVSLTQMALLNQKEIEFLRKSLKDFDRMTLDRKNASGKEENGDAAKSGADLYLANLEKLVDDYKLEVEGLRKQLAASNNFPIEGPTKRPRLVDDSDLRAETATNLRNENLELLAEVRTLKDQILLLENSAIVSQSRSKNSCAPILELRMNPFASDQIVKQEALDVLKKENGDLIARFIENQSVDQVPWAVYARQEHDKDGLENKVDSLMKKINRLRTVYTERSRDIIALISRYFGYSIEFIPNPVNPNDFCSKIKLTSKYMKANEAQADVPYLILDIKKRSMKAHGSYEFKKLCEDLVDQWVNEKYQIPCFLSALNLQIYSDLSPKQE